MSRLKEPKLASLLDKNEEYIPFLPQTATIYEAANEVFIKGAKAVLAIDGTKNTKGLVTEQALIRAICELGEGIFSNKIKTIMNIDLITCAPSLSVSEGLKTISKHKMRHLPLLSDDGDLSGFIHVDAIVKSKLAEIVRDWNAKRK